MTDRFMGALHDNTPGGVACDRAFELARGVPRQGVLMLELALRRHLRALELDHSPSRSAIGRCRCKRCRRG